MELPFVLLGESFSGPVAIAIAANPPPNLVGPVLSTSFARSPMPLLLPFAALTGLAPVRALPDAALSWCRLGQWSSWSLMTALRTALAGVAPAVLHSRAASALRADVTSSLAAVKVPVLHLRASHDRLMSPAAGNRILTGIPHASRIDIPGPHLLLQLAPVSCAAAIADFFGFRP